MYYLKFIETIKDYKKIDEYVAQKCEIHVEVHDYLLGKVYNYIIKDTSREDSSSLNCFIGVNLANKFKWEKIMFHYIINYEEIYKKLINARELKLI